MILFLFCLVVAACAFVSLGFFWGLRKFVQNAEDRSYDEGYQDGYAAARQELGFSPTAPIPQISGAVTQPLVPPLRR